MASSLEDLLAEEGFRGSRLMTRRSLFRPQTMSMPLYLLKDRQKTNSPSGNRIKTERTRSDVSRYTSRGGLPRSDSATSRRSRDSLFRKEKIDGGLKKEFREMVEGRGSYDLHEGKRLNINSSKDVQGKEIVEVGVEENESIEDIYSNQVHNLERRDTFSKGVREKERYKERSGKDIKVDERPGKDIKVDERHSKSSNKHLHGHRGSSDKSRNSMKKPEKPETSYDRSNRGSWKSKSFKDDEHQRRGNIVPEVSQPALDEVAIQAIVSILSGYIKRFLKDEDFRAAIRHNCFSSLNFVEVEKGHSSESKVIANLEQAIKTVERAAEESASAKELKKASLQLSVITGLNSNELKDGLTSGVPNSNLSACAHIYLSVTYKLQKKDRISAKHLLQVFCDSPFQARTTFLPELWDYLFSPHLSHLKVWYKQEAGSLADAPSRPRKLKLLEKVYNELLDSGTYQFAVYYKVWLTEGVEAPSVPSINIPSASVRGIQQGGLLGYSSEVGSPAGAFSPQPMVSKKLYDAVFDRSSKPGVYEAEDNGEADNYNYYLRSSDGSTVEVKETLTYSSETVKPPRQDIEEGSSKSAQDDALDPEDALLLTAEEKWKLLEVSILPERDINDTDSSCNMWQKTAGDTHMLHESRHTKENEITLKRLAKSVFELHHTEGSVDLKVSSLTDPIEAPMHDSQANPIKMRPSFKELQGSNEYFDEGSFFACIPQDFICPLTGQLFEDPVTLETGQTFERAAIKEWFDQENRACPVTGKHLECQTVPLSNFILKRVIDSWKLENSRHLLAFASQIVGTSGVDESKHKDETAIFILEQLLTAISTEERIENAKHLISLGGLQFLIRRFEYGNLEERTRVTALLSCCIEADAGCRNQIARNINKHYLLELIHSKQVKPRTNAALLLSELICLSRRKDVKSFLNGLQNEELVNTMHVVLVYLQSSPPEERPLVAVLLLHLDLMVEPRKYSIYREGAVDAIIQALDYSLTDEIVQEACCKALLILGGRFSYSGKLLTESWILKQAGFNDGCGVNSDNEEDDLLVDDNAPLDDEEQASEEWLRYLSTSLLGSGKFSFLETISKCLGSGNLDLVRVCLTTMAWLSSALSSSSDAELQLSAFSTLISRLKESLEYGEQVEHKVLASMCLLNFSKISECRVLLMTIAEEIADPLRKLAQVTWTARQLYAITSGED